MAKSNEFYPLLSSRSFLSLCLEKEKKRNKTKQNAIKNIYPCVFKRTFSWPIQIAKSIFLLIILISNVNVYACEYYIRFVEKFNWIKEEKYHVYARILSNLNKFIRSTCTHPNYIHMIHQTRTLNVRSFGKLFFIVIASLNLLRNSTKIRE